MLWGLFWNNFHSEIASKFNKYDKEMTSNIELNVKVSRKTEIVIVLNNFSFICNFENIFYSIIIHI